MDKNLLKKYKFVYQRRSLYYINGMRCTLPKFVIASKNPDKEHYYAGDPPYKFEGLMDAPDITHKTTSLTEARWSQVIVVYIKDNAKMLRRRIKYFKSINEEFGKEVHDFAHLQDRLFEAKRDLKFWNSKVAEFEATGIYTYLELMK